MRFFIGLVCSFFVLAQVGHASTPSDFCTISIQLVSVECLPGDLNDPNDDEYLIIASVFGVEGSEGFISPPYYPQPTAFGDLLTFGPFSTTNAPITITVADASNPHCTDELIIELNQSCEEECFIELTDIEYIVGDASYFILATVLGNGSDFWESSDGALGIYGDRFEFGPFVCGENPNILFFDTNEPNSCQDSLVSAPDDLCFCDIDLQLVATTSSTEGWYATVAVNGQGSSFRWEASDGQSFFYGGLATFGPFPCDQEVADITVFDEAIIGCEETISVERPQNTCDDSDCDLEINLGGIEWTDGGLTLQGVVLNGNQPGSWVSNTFDDGDYGSLAEFYINCDSDFVLEVSDATDPTCVDSVIINTEPVCSNCENLNIQTELISVDYFENGTSNTGDDYWTFTLEVNANSNGTFRAMGAGNDTGGIAYGSQVTFGPFFCGIDQFGSYEIFDEYYNACTESAIVSPPAPCENSTPCSTFFTNPEYTSIGDQYFTEVTVGGYGGNNMWFSNTGQMGEYGARVTFGPFDCSDPLDLIVYDSLGLDVCSDTLVPEFSSPICQDTCTLEAVLLDYLATGSSYYFVARIENATNPSGQWQTDNGMQGTYGSLATFGPYPCGDEAEITFTDANGVDCETTVTIQSPIDICGQPCDSLGLSATILSTITDDNNTPNDPSDDFWFFELLVIANDPNSGFTLSPIDLQGTYGQLLTVGPFDCPVGPYTLEIIDNSNPTCSILMVATPPFTDCGANTCNLTAQVDAVECTNDGQFFTATISFSGVDGDVEIIQGSVASSGEPFVIQGIPTAFPPTLTLRSLEDPSCEFNLVVEAPDCEPDPCDSLTLEVELEEIEECGDLPLVSINLAGPDSFIFTIFDDPNGTNVFSQETFNSDTSFTLELPEGLYFFSLENSNCALASQLWVAPQPVFPVDLIYVPSEDCSTTGTIYAPGFGNPFSCSDGVQNGNETGVDCGGFCPPCGTEDLIFDVQDAYGEVGTEVCVDITTRNFDNLSFFIFLISFDPADLSYHSFIENPEFANFFSPLMVSLVNPGEVGIAWAGNIPGTQGLFLADNEVILSLCFTVNSEDPVPISISETGARDNDLQQIQVSAFGGTINPTSFNWTWLNPNGDSIQTNTLSLPVDNLPGEYLLILTDEETDCTDTTSITLPESIFLGCVSVTGTLWADEGSCMLEGDEIPVPEWVVEITSSDGSINTFVITDENGNWTAELPPGDYTAIPSPYQGDLYTECVPPAGFTVDNTTIQHVDILMPYVEECNIMYTHVSIGALRVCEDREIQVYYCNDGPVVAEDAQLEVTFDDLLSVEQVSFPPAQVFGQTYVFDLGNLAPFECGTITFTVMVDCDAELGQVQCVEVIASPNAPCPTPNNTWSGATVEVEVDCDENTGVSFKIENTGLGDMTVPLEYVIIEDVIMMMGNPVTQDPLDNGDLIEIELPADGTSYVLWSNQEPGSPGAMMPTASIEGCGTDENGEFTTGVINQFLTSPTDLDWYRLVCRPINGSFDPNAKVGYPLGYSEENLIEPGTRLTYDLYFQNTGNDFANRVVLVDTLAEEYDLGTIRLGSASHPYTYSLDTNRVLTIVFDDIMLPDSTSDPIGSQGVVQFTIDHLADLPLGTVIENEVDIYFDFNDPIRTNRTRHQLGREFLPTDVDEPLRDLPFWSVYPNPASDWLKVDFPVQHRGLSRVEAIAIDLLGREVLRVELSQGQPLNLKALPSTTYLLRFQDEDGVVIGKAELIKQ
ncbi:MAG: T9SS type A sorting domain-containing protein [Bacteroidota bacterium]